MSKTIQQTPNTTISRLAKRASYDVQTIHTILDESLVCQLAFIRDQIPVSIPTGFVRINDEIYIHGSVGSSYMRQLATGQDTVCISVTHLDGLVLARSAFHHSVNYRSVVVFSKAQLVTNKTELYQALELFTEKVQPGRWAEIRKPTENEWKATMVLKFKIEEASAKIRTGPPKDDEEDYNLSVWAGIVPLKTIREEAIPDPALKQGVEKPGYLL
ncbi:MAG: pyridoxamine 5'-phosphate oxidase family protein [Flammeovirgaceae bacterium]|jgi:nitroimidazol reductase NimA-like FMN-containing flavoprotein (pyridoxamine 5'-phosphate oxidase superfamily)|nr:pyridoxamine 5'-phosphate oxidase family protein [Flammeovirgaceae bacterium]